MSMQTKYDRPVQSGKYGRESGNVLLVFVIAVVSLVGMASLALDGGHLLLNKGRLQNLVDAAALHAAWEIDQPGVTHAQARAAAVNIMQLNLAHSDQSEVAGAFNLSSVDSNTNQMTTELNIAFSLRPDPFIAVADPDAHFVRVTVDKIPLDNFLAGVLGLNKSVSAKALAGPSTAVVNCFTNLVPMMVCGDPTDPVNFGLAPGDLYVMKSQANAGSSLDDSNWEVGSGNFQLLRLGENTGAADIRAALAGEASVGEACFTLGADNESVDTEPGNSVGPVAQGLNTRLGVWNGPVNQYDHPRDFNICEGEEIEMIEDPVTEQEVLDPGQTDQAYRHATYQTAGSCSAVAPAVTVSGDYTETDPARADRRVIQVIMGDCTGLANGANSVDYLGTGCFFLTQKVGTSGQTSYVVGEFIENCSAEGVASGEAEDTPGPYKIVLYHVPGSLDS